MTALDLGLIRKTARGTSQGGGAPHSLDRMTDLCSGWRSGGTAVLSTAAGNGVPMQDCPPAPRPTGADPDAWHDIGELELDWMRRRRCIDVQVGPDGKPLAHEE